MTKGLHVSEGGDKLEIEGWTEEGLEYEVARKKKHGKVCGTSYGFYAVHLRSQLENGCEQMRCFHLFLAPSH